MKPSITLEYAQEGSDSQRMEALQAAGFTAINLGTVHCTQFLCSPSSTRTQFKEQMNSMGFQLDWLHAPYRQPILYDPDSEHHHLSMGALKSCIRIGAELEANSVIVHPFNVDFPDEIDKEPAMQYLVDSFSVLVETGKERGVNIAIENVDEPYSASILSKLFDEIDDLKLCFDVGHAHLWNSWDDYIPKYLERLVALHVHDNHGEKDEHLIPGDGTINYQPFIRLLKSSGYAGYFGLECAQDVSEYPGGWQDLAFTIHKRAVDMIDNN